MIHDGLWSTFTGQHRELHDLSLLEVNEAFASVALHATRMLGADQEIVNVNGGSVALGHALGSTGARMAACSSAWPDPSPNVAASAAEACTSTSVAARPGRVGIVAPRFRSHCRVAAALTRAAGSERPVGRGTVGSEQPC